MLSEIFGSVFIDPKSEMYRSSFEKFKKDYYAFYDYKPQTDEDLLRQKNARDVYRQLARKLHHDYNPHLTETQKDLWHSVQEAYKDQDLERLETLLAMSDVEDEGDFEKIQSISRIYNLTEQYKKDLKAIQLKIKEIKTDIAYGFSALKSKAGLKKFIQKELHNHLQKKTEELDRYKRIVDEWNSALLNKNIL